MINIEEKIEKAREELKESFKYKNINEVPKLLKVVIHRGLGEALTNSTAIEKTYELFYSITGQKPVFTKAKKSISNFKLREGQIVGCKTTMRSKKMHDFLSNLLFLSLPKIRDFRGINKKGCDNFGNFSFGIEDDSIFPQSKTGLEKLRGMDITFCTTAQTKEELLFFLEKIGVPFRR
jgi:large subunit ribosomal protein L5